METLENLALLRNIGISAHIDSGKTTLTERVLFYTGRIHKMEEVKGKSGVGATMDFMDLEREKGITIQSAATFCTWGDYAINIIDTPGHVDFTIEVERALRVLDGAILVLCAVGGVQSQSITVDRQMARYNVPALAFINKCDRAGANPVGVCQQLRDKLRHNAVLIQYPIGLEDNFEGLVDIITREAYYFDGDHGEKIRKEAVPAQIKDAVEETRTKLVEALGDFDDEIAMMFLEERDVPAEKIYPVLRKAALIRKITPVCLGSAYKNKGVQVLLDNVTKFLPSPLERHYEALDQDNNEAKIVLEARTDKPLVMLAFKLEDGRYGQLTYCRIYQGILKKGDTIYNTTRGQKHKAGRLVRMHANEMHDIDASTSGEIVALFGVDCASGDTFTDGEIRCTMTSMHVPEAVITLAVKPTKKEGQEKFSQALNRFAKEDPTFRISLDPESNETIIGGMGELHLEIYLERIRREYKVDVEAGQPQVAYRETITQHVEYDYVHKKQTGGAGQYARVLGYFEPTGNENTYEFLNKIVGGKIPKEYHSSCDKGFREAMQTGTLIGYPVVSVRACINDGASHAVDSSDMAFRIAARSAFRESYSAAKPVVLEPVMKVAVEAPTDFASAVIGSLNRRRGIITGHQTDHGFLSVTSDVPLAEMFGYSSELRSLTQGRGEFTMEFSKYAQAPVSVQEELVKKYQSQANRRVI